MPVVVSGDCAAPAANADAVVTLTPGSGKSVMLVEINGYGYDGDPTGGLLKVAVGGTNYFGPVPITAKGPYWTRFKPFMQFAVDAVVTVTLGAGGSGVKGAIGRVGWLQV